MLGVYGPGAVEQLEQRQVVQGADLGKRPVVAKLGHRPVK
jgi:hypothetical protein